MGLELGFAIGTVIVGAALVIGMRQYERRDRTKEPLTEAATRRNYSEDQSTSRLVEPSATLR